MTCKDWLKTYRKCITCLPYPLNMCLNLKYNTSKRTERQLDNGQTKRHARKRTAGKRLGHSFPYASMLHFPLSKSNPKSGLDHTHWTHHCLENTARIEQGFGTLLISPICNQMVSPPSTCWLRASRPLGAAVTLLNDCSFSLETVLISLSLGFFLSRQLSNPLHQCLRGLNHHRVVVLGSNLVVCLLGRLDGWSWMVHFYPK